MSSRPPPSQSPPQRCTARSFSPRRRSERPTLPRAAIKQARCLPSPHFPSTPTLPLPGTRRCDSRARSPHPSPADQARPDENPPGRSWPSHRRPPCRLMTAQKVAHPPVACRPSPSPCRRFCTNLGLSSVFLPLAPVGRPFNAGGKRRAEPSTTSRRAHGRSKGRRPARRLPPLCPVPATKGTTAKARTEIVRRWIPNAKGFISAVINVYYCRLDIALLAESFCALGATPLVILVLRIREP